MAQPCPLHGIDYVSGRAIRVSHWNVPATGYDAAKRSAFPHANAIKLASCSARDIGTTATVKYCPRCREELMLWLTEAAKGDGHAKALVELLAKHLASPDQNQR